jgi:hypothetical protein
MKTWHTRYGTELKGSDERIRDRDANIEIREMGVEKLEDVW